MRRWGSSCRLRLHGGRATATSYGVTSGGRLVSITPNIEAPGKLRDLALFNLALDIKLRSCDLIALRVRDVYQGPTIAPRAIVMQRKTQRPVQFEITETTRDSVAAWVANAQLRSTSYLFPGRARETHLSSRQHARIVKGWVRSVGLDPARYGTHSLRRTKATLIYKRTKNIRAIQLLLGHSKIESTVRYLGIELDDALEDFRADRDLTQLGDAANATDAISILIALAMS
jgi:integrase